MEGRNFHTSLLGGFRKRDVVTFLADQQRQQEEALQSLQQELEEASAQIREAVAQRDAAQEHAQTLQSQMQEQEAQIAGLQASLAQAQVEAAGLAEERKNALEQAQTQREVNEALRRELEDVQNTPRPCLDEGELRALRQELESQRQRAAELETLLAQPDHRDSREHLWTLCGKMERTLRQMERMLDGPLRMTCYPEPMEVPAVEDLPVEAPVREKPEEPKSKTSVSSLLKKIRRG